MHDPRDPAVEFHGESCATLEVAGGVGIRRPATLSAAQVDLAAGRLPYAFCGCPSLAKRAATMAMRSLPSTRAASIPYKPASISSAIVASRPSFTRPLTISR